MSETVKTAVTVSVTFNVSVTFKWKDYRIEGLDDRRHLASLAAATL